jgi:predicted metal-binding protein
VKEWREVTGKHEGLAMPKQSSKKRNGKFRFLVEEARRLGAIETKIVTPAKVVVEDRVLLKCRTGCNAYGHRFTCPPHAPTPQEFRQILREYRAILVAKFPAEAEADEYVGRSLVKNLCAPDTPADLRTRTKEFWDIWGGDKRRILLAMLALEKAAFNQGYTLAIALTAGSCALCENCNMEGSCAHPTVARYPEHGLGVNVKKTLKNIGMSITFPFEKHPEGIGILLID